MLCDALKTNSEIISISVGNKGLCSLVWVFSCFFFFHNELKYSWEERCGRTQIHVNGQHYIVPFVSARSVVSLDSQTSCFSFGFIQVNQLGMVEQLQSLMH